MNETPNALTAAELVGREWAESRVDELYARSRGHPLFLTELAPIAWLKLWTPYRSRTAGVIGERSGDNTFDPSGTRLMFSTPQATTAHGCICTTSPTASAGRMRSSCSSTSPRSTGCRPTRSTPRTI